MNDTPNDRWGDRAIFWTLVVVVAYAMLSVAGALPGGWRLPL